MAKEFLTAAEAARHLGIARTTFYDWLGQSDRGLLMIRGQAETIEYFQSGRKGQGKIQIEAGEVDRIRDLMRVHSQRTVTRRSPIRQDSFPSINVPLGHPDRHA